jgi:hypothetical protein
MMRAAGYNTIRHLPQESRREGNKEQQAWKALRVVKAEGSDGLRLFRVLIPQGIVNERERDVSVQRWFVMIWEGVQQKWEGADEHSAVLKQSHTGLAMG